MKGRRRESGPRPVRQETVGREERAEAQLLPARVARSFSRPSGAGELRLGVRGWEGSAHFAGANPFPGFPRG